MTIHGLCILTLLPTRYINCPNLPDFKRRISTCNTIDQPQSEATLTLFVIISC
jgi:hypothetical protein